LREHPTTRATSEIDICSARCNRRISAQSSTSCFAVWGCCQAP
jgi:hypothetical protein